MFETAAKELTGQDCIVEYAPEESRASDGRRIFGTMYKSLDRGKPIIRLYPREVDNPPKFLHTFVHECAHVLLDGRSLRPISDESAQIDTPEATEAFVKQLAGPDEDKADYLADAWLDEARKHIMPWQVTNTAAMLRALVNFHKEAERRIVNDEA
jgi:hypothetical protein